MNTNIETKMIIANPGINANSEINISWHTDLSHTNSLLVLTKKEDTNWMNSKTYKGIYEKIDVFNHNYSIDSDRNDIYEDVIFLHYHVELKDLEPNTQYMYKVGEETFSDIHYFKTGSEEFSFAWVSDFHAYNPLPSRLRYAFDTTMKVIDKEKGTDFIFCGGDAIAWGGSYSFWETMYKEPLVKDYMWVNCLGNHDYMSRSNIKNTGDYFIHTNYFPRNGHTPFLGDSFYFTYGDTLFMVINSEVLGFVQESEDITITRNWLEKVLSSSNAKYKIVCQHYDWFQGVNGNSRPFGYLRYKDIFDKYHVKLAMANNNHVYVRTYPLYNDKIDSNGTTYIQSPSADNERGQDLKDYEHNSDIIAKRFSEGGKTVGILFVKIDNKKIRVSLYNRDIQIVDEYIIYKKN